MRFKNKSAVSMGGGSAKVPKKASKNKCIWITVAFLIVTHTEICFQKKYFRYPYPFGPRFELSFLELPLLRPYCAPQNTHVADVFVCGTNFHLLLQVAPSKAENTLCNTLK